MVQITQDSSWTLMADLFDPRRPDEKWPAGSKASVVGMCLLKPEGEILLESDEWPAMPTQRRWVSLGGFRKAIEVGAIVEAEDDE